MIYIGKQYIIRKENRSYVCADVKTGEFEDTLWFSIDEEYEEFLSKESCEAFVMELLPLAMRTGQEILCEDKLSERFSHGLNEYLIPTIASFGTKYTSVKVKAPLKREKREDAKGIGVHVSKTKEFESMINEMKNDELYPLTHICVFNLGDEKMKENCELAEKYAKKLDIKMIALDSNCAEIIDEEFSEVSSFRELAGALMLQNVLQTYLFVSENALDGVGVNENIAESFDFITANFADTETMTVYLTGYETEAEAETC